MHARFLLVFAGFSLLPACSGESASSEVGGGGGGTTTSSTSDGGSGGGTTTTDTTTTSTTTSTTSTTTPVDLCATAGADPVSFANDVQPIFSQSCGSNTTCHLKAIPSESLSLKVEQAYAALVNVPAKQKCNSQVRVAPGSASDSYLVNKITATGVCPNEKKMPPSTTLSEAKQQTIIDWICQGAQDN